MGTRVYRWNEYRGQASCQKTTRSGKGFPTLHFLFAGPWSVSWNRHLSETGRFARGRTILPTKRPAGPSGEGICRTISDGPNEPAQQLSKILLGAISTARKRVQIMTPYFLPSTEMISVCRQRHFAASRWRSSCRSSTTSRLYNGPPTTCWEICSNTGWMFFQPPPFVHSKIFVIDGIYAQIGSANIDPRSLLLNFELNVEIYDMDFAGKMAALIK
jgi:cardiolipin synthase A/B